MPRPPSAKILALLAVLLPASACAKKTPPATVTVAADESAASISDLDDGSSTGEATRPQPRPQGKPLHVKASVTGLGDLLQLVKQATQAWNPKNPIDASAWVQAALLQMGYGPGLWSSLDLTGVMAVDSTFYLDAPTTDLRLAGSLAALSAKGVMDGMPSTQRPQPLGNGMWEYVQGELRVLLRERPKALEFGLSAADLERAASVASEASGGRRLKVHASDLPPGMLSADSFPLLTPGLRRQVSAVLREANNAAIELDAGTDRDLVLELAADGPFDRLGLSPLGTARVSPTALEGRLPAGPALVVAIPWGSPELLHKFLDSAQKAVDQLGGGAFTAQGKQMIVASHALLDQLQNDVVLAVYVGTRGEFTAVIAGDVKDEVATRKATSEILSAIKGALTAFNTLGGDKKDASISINLKAGGLKTDAGSGDTLSLGLPKNMAKETEDLKTLLDDKQQLELVTLVAGGSASLVFGANARALAAQIGKHSGAAGGKAIKTSLASDGGLALARFASKGCHFCVGLDPIGVARFAVHNTPERRADKAQIKDLEAAAVVLTRIGGALGFGLKLEPKHGALAGALKKSLLVLAPADAAAVGKLLDIIVAPPAPASDKPLSGPLGGKSSA
ncbi:MAG: hypothetical protein H0T76_06240 [Nannocystis sp.]|nr:hypothetical protein [Nannocystis sp.]MBA3546061.1 hypothetical protein [Nannocystis sp.]